MTLNLIIPPQAHTDFTPRITVIGVGGGGTNAVDNMIAANLQGVEFVVANTDAQQLMHSRADRRIQLGPHLTQGLGAGAKPEIGKAAAEEAADELFRHLDGAHMVFITAGMGGGTGTGAAPVIARMARERGILTVGVVTKPFGFEGVRRGRAADVGIEELQQYVDTLIVIPNQNLFRMATERTTWKDAFKMADQVLYMGVRGVTDLMMAHGLINLDFADVKAVMLEMGKAMMGTGEADGDNRAIRAAEAAINNPLLEDTSMSGAKGLLINITGGEDLTLFEVDQAVTRIRDEVDEEANVIFGSAIDETLNGRIRVSVVATGIDSPRASAAAGPRLVSVAGAKPEPQPIPMPTAGIGPVPQLRQTSSVREVPVMEAPQPHTARPAMARPETAHPEIARPEMARPEMARPEHEPARAEFVRPAVQPSPAMHAPVAPRLQPQRPPVQPTLQANPTARQDARPAFFAPPPPRPQATTPAAPAQTFQAYVPPNAGPSIFSRVTGALAFKRRSAATEDAPPPRPEGSFTPAQRTQAVPNPSADRETDGGDIENVPAFLRRQQSTP
jgi:cell division protein FtsZ